MGQTLGGVALVDVARTRPFDPLRRRAAGLLQGEGLSAPASNASGDGAEPMRPARRAALDLE